MGILLARLNRAPRPANLCMLGAVDKIHGGTFGTSNGSAPNNALDGRGDGSSVAGAADLREIVDAYEAFWEESCARADRRMVGTSPAAGGEAGRDAASTDGHNASAAAAAAWSARKEKKLQAKRDFLSSARARTAEAGGSSSPSRTWAPVPCLTRERSTIAARAE